MRVCENTPGPNACHSTTYFKVFTGNVRIHFVIVERATTRGIHALDGLGLVVVYAGQNHGGDTLGTVPMTAVFQTHKFTVPYEEVLRVNVLCE
jgi:hypothetical protein